MGKHTKVIFVRVCHKFTINATIFLEKGKIKKTLLIYFTLTTLQYRFLDSIVRQITKCKEKIVSGQALFQGLVIDENHQPVETAFVGGDAHYVVDDQGFKRHIDAETVDRQVLAFFVNQLKNNKELAVEQALNFLGQDDLFTKAALDSSIDNVEIDEIMRQGIPDQARNMLGMMGFRIVINHHGEIVDLRQPEVPYEDDDN